MARCVIVPVLSIIAFFFFFFLNHFITSGAFSFTLFAAIWWLIWKLHYVEGGIPKFYSELVFATIPLAAFTSLFIWHHPVPDDTLMIPLLPEEIRFDFSTAVTCTLLFPIYSIVLHQYLFNRGHSWRRLVGSASFVMIVGTVIFTMCYQLLPPGW